MTIELLRQKVTELIEKKVVLQNTIAKSIGVSDSLISAWRKGTYTGDNEKVKLLLEEFLSKMNRTGVEIKSIKRDFDFVETSVYNEVKSGVELANLRGEIRAIVGDSGVGKTTALKKIKHLNQNMIFVQVYRGIRKNRFLQKLCSAAGVSARGSFDTMLEELFVKLENIGRLIVVDEAEHLPIDAIDALRRLNDFTGCGIVICGLPIMLSTLQQRQGDFGYIYNRMSLSVILNTLTELDVDMMVKTILPHSDINVGVWLKACHGIGRDLKFIILETIRVAKLNNQDVTSAMIHDIKNKLGRVYYKN